MISQTPITNSLAPVTSAFLSRMIADLSFESDISDYLRMLQTCPIASAVVQIKQLIGLQYLGEYIHPDPNIQEGISTMIERMDGAFLWSVSELQLAQQIGTALAEISVEAKDGMFPLKKIIALDPRKCIWRGDLANGVTEVKYSADVEIKIPYEHLIHVVSGRNLGSYGNPNGVGECKAVVNAWRAWVILVSELLVAAKRQSTPVLWGQTETEDDVIILDSLGNELTRVKKGTKLLEDMQALENGYVLVTDMQTQINVLQQQTNGMFLIDAIKLVESMIMHGFQVADTILTVTGTGDSNLNAGQRTTMAQVQKSFMRNNLCETLLEQLFRPLIVWNYGEQETYGAFSEPTEEDNENANLLIKSIADANTAGLFTAADMGIANRARRLAGIPEITDQIEAMARRTAERYGTIAP